MLEVTQAKSQRQTGHSLLKLGEQLTARVSNYSSSQQYTLKSGNLQLQLKSALPLQVGQKVELVVTRTHPTLQLRMASPTPAQQNIQQALRSAVVKQLPLDQTLSTLLKQNSAGLLPDSITKALLKIQKSLPDSRAISQAHSLKQALLNSGPFLEQSLAKELMGNLKSGHAVNHDLKAQLLRLALLIKESRTAQQSHLTLSAHTSKTTLHPITSPMSLWDLLFKREQKAATRSHKPETGNSSQELQPSLKLLKNLGEKVEGALARQQLNQLTNLPTQDDARPPWYVEIPVIKNGELSLLKLHIQQNSTGGTDNLQASWQVTIELTLPHLGLLRVNVNLKGRELITHLWSEESQLITPYLEVLKRGLEKQGLTVAEINCHQGIPTPPQPPKSLRGLLDVKA